MTDTVIFAGRYRLLNPLPDLTAANVTAPMMNAWRALSKSACSTPSRVQTKQQPASRPPAPLPASSTPTSRVSSTPGATADQVYVVSEWIDGTTLAERQRRPLPPGRELAVALAGDMARGLAAAHAVQVTHGGLSPERCRVDAQERAHLTDFGLRATAPWAAPEVATGGAPTPASDVYALGAILHTLVTGHPPDPHADAACRSRPLPNRYAVCLAAPWRPTPPTVHRLPPLSKSCNPSSTAPPMRHVH